MHSLEDRQIVLEATNHLRLVPWLLGDLPLVGGQPLSGNTCGSKHAPVLLLVATTLEEGQECLANGNVVWRSVVVQLLMPLLVELALDLRNAVPMHDVEDLVSDLLAVARAFADEADYRENTID